MRSLLVAGVILVGLAAMPADAFDGARFGDVHVAQPDRPSTGYVLLFSDHGGWSPADQAALEALAKLGSLAVGVDLDTYLHQVAPVTNPGVRPCGELVGDVEGLSQKLQRAQTGNIYHFPILAGVGAGGALAQLILASAPPSTIAGAATVDPDASTPDGLACSLPSIIVRSGMEAGVAPLKSNGFWTVGLTPGVSDVKHSAIEVKRGAGTPIDIHQRVSDNLAVALASLIGPHLDRLDLQGLAAFPLVPLPVPHASRLMVVLLSGDGGWRDLDKTIGEALRQEGVPVVGFDSLRYFWHMKTAEQTAQDLATIIRGYRAKWNAEKVALVGYSFGANVLPATYNALPSDVKGAIVLVSFLGLETRADWEIKISGWFGAAPSSAATPVAGDLQKLPAPMVQCFYGEDETDTSCPSLVSSKAEILKTKGGHHFNGEYSTIAREILDGFHRRAGSAG